MIWSQKAESLLVAVFGPIHPGWEESNEMDVSPFSDAQKAFILEQGNEWGSVAEICRRTGISQATDFNWKKKYSGLQPLETRRLTQLRDDNAKLRTLAAHMSLDREMPRYIVQRKL